MLQLKVNVGTTAAHVIKATVRISELPVVAVKLVSETYDSDSDTS